MKEIGTTLAKQDSLRIATLGREANKQDSTIYGNKEKTYWTNIGPTR